VQAGGLPVRKLYVAHCGNACAEPQWQRRAALGFQWKVERLYSSVYAHPAKDIVVPSVKKLIRRVVALIRLSPQLRSDFQLKPRAMGPTGPEPS
jgi:hypothetical protein